MVTLTKIYTKTGDLGDTGLGDGRRVSKASLRIAAIGAVDETNCAIGVARLHAADDADTMLGRIQNELFDLGADLAVPQDARNAETRLRIVPAQVTRLEQEMDAMNRHLAPLTSFVLPGGSALSAQLHMARAICRRAERALVDLMAREEVNAQALKYLNRLSDHLFMLARTANDEGRDDVLWVPGASRDARPEDA